MRIKDIQVDGFGVWNNLKPNLPMLAEVVIHETCTSRCHYAGK